MRNNKNVIVVDDAVMNRLQSIANGEVRVKELLRTELDISSVAFNKSHGLDVGISKTVVFLMTDGKEMELNSNYVERCMYFPHPDLTEAMNMLRSHIAFLAELPEAKDKGLIELEDEKIEEEGEEPKSALHRIYVTGFDRDPLGVKIQAQKLLNRGKMMKLSIPPVKWHEDAGAKPYDYADELHHILTHIEEEVRLYLNGKVAPSAQTSLDFPDQEDDLADEDLDD